MEKSNNVYVNSKGELMYGFKNTCSTACTEAKIKGLVNDSSSNYIFFTLTLTNKY